jgi:hypothetical protein
VGDHQLCEQQVDRTADFLEKDKRPRSLFSLQRTLLYLNVLRKLEDGGEGLEDVALDLIVVRVAEHFHVRVQRLLLLRLRRVTICKDKNIDIL